MTEYKGIRMTDDIQDQLGHKVNKYLNDKGLKV